MRFDESCDWQDDPDAVKCGAHGNRWPETGCGEVVARSTTVACDEADDDSVRLCVNCAPTVVR